jgi:hypothetical protein
MCEIAILIVLAAALDSAIRVGANGIAHFASLTPAASTAAEATSTAVLDAITAHTAEATE